jgi:hypothetical protein
MTPNEPMNAHIATTATSFRRREVRLRRAAFRLAAIASACSRIGLVRCGSSA